MSKELEKVISKLSQKSKDKAKTEAKAIKKEVVAEVDQDAEDLKTLTQDPVAPVPKFAEVPAEASEPSPQAISKIEELEQQVVRLRDDGVYRVELLFQLQEINQGIAEINAFFRKLVSEDGEENE